MLLWGNPVPAPLTEKGGSLTAHVSWLMCAKTIGFAFTMALPMVLVRRLDQAQFGVYKQLFLVIATSVTVLPLGFGMSAYYFLPREPERQRETVLNILLYSLVVGCLVCAAFFLWPAVLDVIFHQPGLTGYAHLTGCVILLLIFSQALEIIPIAHGEMKVASAMIVGIQVTRTGIYLAAVLVFGSVKALVWAAVAQGILQTGVLWWYSAIPLRRFLAAFRLGFDAQPGVLRRAVRLGRHTLYRSNRFAQLLRFQPAGRQWLTPSTGWAWCSCR